MDLLFVHVPKFNNQCRPFNHFSFINLPPMGLLGLADFLRRNNCSTRVVHLGVEKYKYGEVDLNRIVSEHQPSMVGLGLHWHFQAYDVIETARKIKKDHPGVAIVLGGFTASAFAEEILQAFDCVDFVIRGDAEVPLRELIAQHRAGKAYQRVPNLVFREGQAVRANPVSYVGGPGVLDSLCYTDFTLMKDYPTFVNCFSRYIHLEDISENLQQLLIGQEKMYPVFLGRGCVYNCSFCGGAQIAQKHNNNRSEIYLRPVKAVLDSLKDLERFGFESAGLALDPPPIPAREKFYCEVLKGIRDENISLSIEVERYHLPSLEFIRRLRELPRSDSYVTLSPGSHNEEIRRKNGLYRYSNAELEECLGVMEKEGVNSLICFSAGLPFERESDLKAMGRYLRRLQWKFKRARCRTSMIEIEPESPMSSKAREFGVMPKRSTFMDYYRYHEQPGRNHFLEMGYERVGCPTEAETKKLFCRHLCTRFNLRWLPPLVSRGLCSAAAAMWKSGGFGALDKLAGVLPDSTIRGNMTAPAPAPALRRT
ncbi:MAG TPA: cobalamin-dependent protein [Terriglobia bacterium]|nr:cobalamin-dependent protein [Terriglobia bacterium]